MPCPHWLPTLYCLGGCMLLVRVCKACNCTFEGGPHAWYCPKCRKLRKKEYTEKNVIRKNQGESRQIGKLDLCEMCSKPYTVMSGTQRYCPECAPKAQAEKIDAKRRRATKQTRRQSIPGVALNEKEPESVRIPVKYAGRNILASMPMAAARRNALNTSVI